MYVIDARRIPYGVGQTAATVPVCLLFAQPINHVRCEAVYVSQNDERNVYHLTEN